MKIKNLLKRKILPDTILGHAAGMAISLISAIIFSARINYLFYMVFCILSVLSLVVFVIFFFIAVFKEIGRILKKGFRILTADRLTIVFYGNEGAK